MMEWHVKLRIVLIALCVGLFVYGALTMPHSDCEFNPKDEWACWTPERDLAFFEMVAGLFGIALLSISLIPEKKRGVEEENVSE
jgi:hypothetical protein